MTQAEITGEEIDQLYARLNREAEAGGYHMNPDAEFTKEMVKGLITNERRYGYWACPCRLASGVKADDRDIICPCDYRDADLLDYGTCYCALYASGVALRGEKKIESIPERRPPPEKRKRPEAAARNGGGIEPPLPVWRCKVCGYLCARESPPEVCPICRARQDRFERFL